MSNSLFYTGLSGLNVAQGSLVTTGHNTANVNTPGYRRQTANISSSGGLLKPNVGFFGNGSHIDSVTRNYDSFLATQFNQAKALNEALTTYSSQITRVDDMLANQTSGLAPLMQNFFAGVQGVANVPADSAARQQMINSAQSMTNQFRSMSQYLTDLNSGVNQQIETNAEHINVFSDQIANLNKQIALLSGAGDGQPPNDLLDQRDQLVTDLSKLIGTKVVVQDGGQYNVFIGNGQTLVLGNVAYELQAVTSAVDPSRTSVAVVGASGTSIELKDSALTGGALGGLLQFRNETLVVAQNSIGRIAIALSDTFNAQHNLGVDLNGALGQDFFSQASPSTLPNARNSGTLLLDATFSDTAQLTISDYTVEVNAGGNYVLTRLSDKQVLSPVGGYTNGDFPLTFDGITLAQVIPVGVAQPGDSFLVQPTGSGARDFDVLITDVAQVAAAAPIVTGNVAANKGSGVINAGSVDAAYLATPLAAAVTLSYASATTTLSGFPALSPVTVTLPNGTATTYAAGTPVPYTSGATISFDGITVTLSGAPADGDSFTIAPNTGGVSDGRNALLLGALPLQKTIGGSTATFNDAYAQLVSNIGNKTRQIDISNAAQTSLVAQIRFADQSVTGVNQDEETANLLMFQQMYQANAKVIQTASTIFDAVLALR